jgi:alpha-L-fucosidase 2
MLRPICLALLAFVAAFSARGATEAQFHRDVVYGRAGDVDLKLDVSVPAGEGPFPVAVLVHGGGWSSGSKAGSDQPGGGGDITPWFALFNRGGYVWFSIDYRLAPAHRWPAQDEDVRAALRWVKAHAAQYRGDASRVVLVGHSAGGHLATFAGVRGEGDTAVAAVVGFAPVTDLVFDSVHRGGLSASLQMLFGLAKELTPASEAPLRAASPSTHVRAGLPPFLLIQGDADRTVPIAMSRAFQEKMRAAGNTCDLIALPDAGHGLLKWHESMPEWDARVLRWLDEHLSVRR